jgi:hypothetical protein
VTASEENITGHGGPDNIRIMPESSRLADLSCTMATCRCCSGKVICDNNFWTVVLLGTPLLTVLVYFCCRGQFLEERVG